MPYDVHLVHTRVPWNVIADDRESILCGGASPRGLSDETTSLGTMATSLQRQVNSSPSSSLGPGRRLLGEGLSAGHQGCGPTGRTARILAPIASPTSSSKKGSQGMALQAIQQQTLTRSQGMVFLFRWPCYQIQVNTPVDVWSNHACQVAQFFDAASALLAQVGGTDNPRSSPASRKCTPRQPEEHVNPQVASCPRSTRKVCLGGLAVTGVWARNAP